MSILIKTIGALKGFRFVVPSYQRGYRWKDKEIEALLNDIFSFDADNNNMYCIQPLVVKPRENGSYEVVDGQQRLTTIYIFMKIAEEEIRSATPMFDLQYDTRDNSRQFLINIKNMLDQCNENIDYFHMSKAYSVINKWLDKQDDKSVAIQVLNTRIRIHVFFIWHEIAEDSDPIKMFTKINMGRIPLTNSELIKALLMNKNNFSGDIEKQQLEMSLAWDRIEQQLQNDSFWYFIKNDDEYATRIDLLFDLLAKESGVCKFATTEKYFSFLVFNETLEKIIEIEDKSNYVSEIWCKIDNMFSEILSWYENIDKYHSIGFLLATGQFAIQDIFDMIKNKKRALLI